jgi:hypothetical protein
MSNTQIDHLANFKKVVDLAITEATESGVRDHEIIKHLRKRADGLIAPTQWVSPMSDRSVAQPELRAALAEKERLRAQREYEASKIPENQRQTAASGYRVR